MCLFCSLNAMGGGSFRWSAKTFSFFREEKRTQTQTLGSGYPQVGWGFSMWRDGGRKVRYVPRNQGNQTLLAGFPGILPGYPGGARKAWEKSLCSIFVPYFHGNFRKTPPLRMTSSFANVSGKGVMESLNYTCSVEPLPNSACGMWSPGRNYIPPPSSPFSGHTAVFFQGRGGLVNILSPPPTGILYAPPPFFYTPPAPRRAFFFQMHPHATVRVSPGRCQHVLIGLANCTHDKTYNNIHR